MHELSIAKALMGLVSEHVPIGSRLRKVTVRIGAMQAIVPEAMHNAWRVATHDVGFADAELVIEYQPWTLTCRVCHREWVSDEPYARCACGSRRSAMRGSDEITLVSIDVVDTASCEQSHTESREAVSVPTRELVR